jgi:hypothetical protein
MSVPSEAGERREFPRPITKIHIHCTFFQTNSGEEKGGSSGQFVSAAERCAVLGELDAAATAGQGDAAANYVTLAKSCTVVLKIFRVALFTSSTKAIAAFICAQL